VDIGEVIALDIPFSIYASHQQYYRAAFVKAFANATGRQVSSVYVTNFQTSSAGTTLIYFDTILFGTDYDTVAANAAVHALFNGTAVGSPALPVLVNAFIANGLPVGGAYYNDQLASTPSAYTATGTPPIAADKVGTWQHADTGEVIALDISYGVYATKEQFYKEAFAAAMSSTLGLEPDSVWVTDFEQSAARSVLVYYEILLSPTSSTAVTNTFAEVVNLFTDCHPSTGDRVGCPAQPTACTSLPCTSTLVTKLKQFGLPVTNAYYSQQNAPAGR